MFLTHDVAMSEALEGALVWAQPFFKPASSVINHACPVSSRQLAFSAIAMVSDVTGIVPRADSRAGNPGF